jgi:uncharacterized repeat protein (TIGR03803 family)
MLAAVAALIAVAGFPGKSAAQTLITLYSFCPGGFPCSDGAGPGSGGSGVIADASGNLYGTTEFGGAVSYPGGTVFKVTPTGSETVLYSFTGGSDGSLPNAGLIADAAGNLYGMTNAGGVVCIGIGCGVVFEVTPSGTETVLHRFTFGDGATPVAGSLIADAAGNLYGTTSAGGTGNQGTVFQLMPSGTLTVLYTFTGGSDGAAPSAGLIADGVGNLYGTASAGGTSGNGTVFKVMPSGTETVLYSFCPGGVTCTDGVNPEANLIADAAGNFYSTTQNGGSPNVCGGGVGCGTVFKLTPSGTETVLYSFCPGGGSCTDGAGPVAGLIADAAGNLYGTTSAGGTSGHGTVFKVTPSGTESFLLVTTPNSL